MPAPAEAGSCSSAINRAAPPVRTICPALAWRYPTNPPTPVSARMPATPGIAKATSCDVPAARKYSVYPTRNDAGTATLLSILAGSGSRPAGGSVVLGRGAPGSVGLVGAPGATAPPSPIDGATTTGKVMGASGTAAAPASGTPAADPVPPASGSPATAPAAPGTAAMTAGGTGIPGTAASTRGGGSCMSGGGSGRPFGTSTATPSATATARWRRFVRVGSGSRRGSSGASAVLRAWSSVRAVASAVLRAWSTVGFGACRRRLRRSAVFAVGGSSGLVGGSSVLRSHGFGSSVGWIFVGSGDGSSAWILCRRWILAADSLGRRLFGILASAVDCSSLLTRRCVAGLPPPSRSPGSANASAPPAPPMISPDTTRQAEAAFRTRDPSNFPTPHGIARQPFDGVRDCRTNALPGLLLDQNRP